jgi:hypothetical protein
MFELTLTLTLTAQISSETTVSASLVVLSRVLSTGETTTYHKNPVSKMYDLALVI